MKVLAMSPTLKSGLILIATVIGIGVLVSLIDPPQTHFVATLEQTYGMTRLITLMFISIALWEIVYLLRTASKDRFSLAWRVPLRSLWLPTLLMAGAVIFLTYLSDNTSGDSLYQLPWEHTSRIVETIVPLAVGSLSALMFSPTDEPAIEVQLACPRPIAWVLIERLMLVILAGTMVALMGIVFAGLRFGELDTGIALIRWIPPSLFLSSVGVFTTIKSHQIMLGVAIVGAVWFGTVIFQIFFLPGLVIFYPLNYIQPFLWVINPYLQPDYLPMSAYWLNRLCVLAFGITLLALSVRSLRDEEHILTGIKAI
ncbi:MAG: hypothetical protein RLP44_11080 [Aggregatilineales bacterium]